MISYLKGTIIEKYPTKLLLDVNGIGYEINITLNCSKQVGNYGDVATILTYLYTKDENIRLYGFIANQERELFTQLISAPGIGPKKALAILSSSTVDDLQKFIIEEDIDALTSLSGVGRKTAQRLIVDLKEKLVSISRISLDTIPGQNRLVEEAILALISLGYRNNIAEKAIQSVITEKGENIGLEELIKQALKKI